MLDRTAEQLADRLAALSPEDRRRLQQRLRTRPGAGGDPAPTPVARDGRPLPASFLQERLWLVDQIVPGSTAYLVTLALRLRGELRADLLAPALSAVVERHEVLRTGLAWVGDQLTQVVQDRVEVPLRAVDLGSSGAAATDLRRLFVEEAANGFDLTEAPLWRALVVRLGEREHAFAMFLHHAITDGWSNTLLRRDLGTAYRALVEGRAPALPPPRLQYADVAAWQRRRLAGRRLTDLLEYWRDRLRGAPELFGLPLDRPRRADRIPCGGGRRFHVPAAVTAQLSALGRQERATEAMVALASLAVALARWSGQADVVVGSPLHGRVLPELAEVAGPLVNTVVLRLDPSAEASGRALVASARQTILDAQAHSDLPFERVVDQLRPRRSAAYHPVFQVNFGVQGPTGGRPSLPGLTAEPLTVTADRPPKFDLSVYLTIGAAGWSGFIEYNADLFDDRTIGRLADGFVTTLGELAEDPDRRVTDLPAAAPRQPAAPATGAVATAPGTADLAVPARDRWERGVALAWEQVLGTGPLRAGDDFFELGGHSMAGMLAVERIREITGRRVYLATLFRHPTVATLAAAVREADPSADPPFVVSLQPGGQLPPLFLAPPAVGELAIYFPLVRELGRDRPVHGLQPDGFFRGADPGDRSLLAQADAYAEEIVRAFPPGPYHLCGFSAAGRLAVAIADQLSRRRQPVGSVVLLDSAPFGDVPPDPDLATVLSRWLPFTPPVAELSALGREEQIARTLAAGQRAGALPRELGRSEFRTWCRKVEFGARALAGHGPLRYPGTITLLMWARRTRRDISREWQEMPIGGLRVVPVDVESHLGLVDGPQVSMVARLLAGELAGSEDG